MAMYQIETCGQLHPFLSMEWLLTNGLGSFASSTVVGCNTRRYHGLLCAASTPPVGRIMTLNRLGELLRPEGSGQEWWELSINQFGGSFHPRGDRYLRRFELNQVARWEYALDGVGIVKEVQLVWEQNAVGIRYTIQVQGPHAVQLRLLPFVSMRDFHSLCSAKKTSFRVSQDERGICVANDVARLYLCADAGDLRQRADWWYGHTYAIETERGLDDAEDLFVPAELVLNTSEASRVTLWATLDEPRIFDWEAELSRRPDPLSWAAASTGPLPGDRIRFPASGTIQRLARAAADFVVHRRGPDGKPATTVIAGYPWFSDWGRDTMISLPGLLLTPARYAEARQVLCLFAQYVNQGMIPNRFDDYTNEPSYNTVDASLWFIHACFEYLRHTDDRAMFESQLLPACRQIVEGYQRGTRYGIAMDPEDGLITAGDRSTQLTWMDAKCGQTVFTPRHGKAVEVNALWHNALALLGCSELAERVRRSFVQAFWLNPFRGLCDVVHGGHRDDSLRPNQIFAVSLPHSPLDRNQQHAVVEAVRRELLTPYGLRTLSPRDPGYHGRYQGPPMARDRAYHNGTVWAWLIGPFLEAYLRVHENSLDAQRQARVWLQPLVDHLNQGCIGQIAECFEGDEPHRPVASPAQAWSVAEVLRLAVRLGL